MIDEGNNFPPKPMSLGTRARFRESQAGKAWANTVQSDWFQIGLETALITYTMNTGRSPDITSNALIAARAEGVRDFIHVMLTLTDVEPEKPRAKMPANLKPV